MVGIAHATNTSFQGAVGREPGDPRSRTGELAPAAASGPVDSIPPAVATHPVYLDLGDSVGMWNGNDSYPNLLAGYYRQDVPHLQLVNMACAGETTQSMMSGSVCAPVGSQVRDAVAFLRSHRGEMALVTIDIGGNNVVGCAGVPDPTTCVIRLLPVVKVQMTFILDARRLAAGPRVPIVGMNIFDPVLGDWLGPQATRAQAMAAVISVSKLDSAMDAVYAAASSPVANIEGAFSSQNMVHFVASKWGRVPVAVDKACALLDIECIEGQSEGFGDDPNVAGARVIAATFEKGIGHLKPPS